jgi:hypothetical protein
MTARCDHCFLTAVVLQVREGVALCERCARDDSAHDRGEAYAALGILDATLGALSSAGLTGEEIIDVVTCWTENRPHRDEADPPMPAWAAGGFAHDDRFVRLDGAKET